MAGTSNEGQDNVKVLGGNKLGGILHINYFDPVTNKSCLEGLTIEEKLLFQGIVLKQFERGIKIVITYFELPVD